MAKPKYKPFVQYQQTRKLHEWNADRIRSAEALAESGNLQLLADLVEGLIFPDDRVLRCLRSLCNGLLQLPLSFEDGTGKLRRRARKAIEAQEDWWNMFPDVELVQVLRWAAILNIGLGQLVWKTSGNRWLPRLQHWNPRNLRWDIWKRVWYVRIDSGAEIPIEPGDGQWMLFTPNGNDRPWIHSPWKILAKLCLLKQYSLTDWARHSQGAAGTKVGTTPVPKAEDADAVDRDLQAERDQLAEELSQPGTELAVVLPAGWDLKNLAQPADTYKTFLAQQDLANACIAIVLCGQNLTSEVKAGAFASTSVHANVENTVLTTWGGSVSTVCHEQVLPWWAYYNFGDVGVAPWPLFDTSLPEDLAALVVGWSGAADVIAKFIALGLEPDVEAIAAKVRFPFLKKVQLQ